MVGTITDMTQYPGPDPDDPFSRPTNEQDPSTQNPPLPPAAEQQEQPEQPQTENPWAGYGQPTPPYQQEPVQQPYQQAQPGEPAYAPGYQSYGAQAYGMPPPNHPQATTAMVLGLVSLIGGCICGLPLLAAPFAWVIGAKAKREIAASNGQLGGEGSAQAGFIMGIIASVLLVLAVLALVLLLVVAIASSGGSSSSDTTF